MIIWIPPGGNLGSKAVFDFVGDPEDLDLSVDEALLSSFESLLSSFESFGLLSSFESFESEGDGVIEALESSDSLESFDVGVGADSNELAVGKRAELAALTKKKRKKSKLTGIPLVFLSRKNRGQRCRPEGNRDIIIRTP